MHLPIVKASSLSYSRWIFKKPFSTRTAMNSLLRKREKLHLDFRTPSDENEVFFPPDLRAFLEKFSGADSPQEPIWSFTDLIYEPQNQKMLRAAIETHGVDDLQFLRWRNALISTNVVDAVNCLSYGLRTLEGVFERPLPPENPSKAFRGTPSWIVQSIVCDKLSLPEHIPLSLELFRLHGPTLSTMRMLTSVTSYCIKNEVYSILPEVLSVVRTFHRYPEDPHRPSFLASILLTLSESPRVGGERHPSRSQAGPQTDIRTYMTAYEIQETIDTFIFSQLVLDRRTWLALVNARPTLVPSTLHRLMGKIKVDVPPPPGYALVALARAYAADGRKFSARQALDIAEKRKAAQKQKGIFYGSRIGDQLEQSDRPHHNQSPSPPSYISIDENFASRAHAIFIRAFANEAGSRLTRRTPKEVISYFRRLKGYAESVASNRDKTPSQTIIMAWNAFIQTMAAQRGVPANTLLGLIESAAALQIGDRILNIPTVTACVFAFVKRGEYKAATKLWDTFLGTRSTKSLDWYAITAGGIAWTYSGKAVDAFDLFVSVSGCGFGVKDTARSNVWLSHRRKVHPSDDIREDALPTNSEVTGGNFTALSDIRPTSPEVYVQSKAGKRIFMNAFMRSLGFLGRPNIVYELWDNMEELFDIRPDNLTLTNLITTASEYSDRRNAVTINQQLGWDGTIWKTSKTHIFHEERISHIRRSLATPQSEVSRDIGFWWGSKPAWQIARQIFREVILGNWPALSQLTFPAIANRPSGQRLIDWSRDRKLLELGALHTGSKPVGQRRKGASGLRSLGVNLVIGKYYDIIPTSRLFSAYIRLLCKHDCVHEVPEALLWARELGIIPSRNMLRISLVHFSGEIGASSPFDTLVLGRGNDVGPAEQLRAWIHDWVGSQGMPTRREIEVARSIWGTKKSNPARIAFDKKQKAEIGRKYLSSRKDRSRWTIGSKWARKMHARELRGRDQYGHGRSARKMSIQVW